MVAKKWLHALSSECKISPLSKRVLYLIIRKDTVISGNYNSKDTRYDSSLDKLDEIEETQQEQKHIQIYRNKEAESQ